MKSWWCKHYNRPRKDPILQTYTFHELMYEFFEFQERDKAISRVQEQESDKIEEAKQSAAEDWAAEEERKEREEMEQAMKKAGQAKDPRLDAENQEWMRKKLEEAAALAAAGKQEFGDDFGEDIEEDFSDG